MTINADEIISLTVHTNHIEVVATTGDYKGDLTAESIYNYLIAAQSNKDIRISDGFS